MAKTAAERGIDPKDRCPKCNALIILVGKAHRCEPPRAAVPVVAPAPAKPKAKKTKRKVKK